MIWTSKDKLGFISQYGGESNRAEETLLKTQRRYLMSRMSRKVCLQCEFTVGNGGGIQLEIQAGFDGKSFVLLLIVVGAIEDSEGLESTEF